MLLSEGSLKGKDIIRINNQGDKDKKEINSLKEMQYERQLIGAKDNKWPY
jgi:hypothetical protein